MTGIEIYGIIIGSFGLIGLLLFGIAEIINTIRKTDYYKSKVINTILNNLNGVKSLEEIIKEIKEND